MRRAFTTIELLTVTFIIALMTGLILPNWRAGKSQFVLDRATSKFAQDIRRVQEMTLAASEVGGEIPYGYGLHIEISDPDSYFIYADFDGAANDGDLDWDNPPSGWEDCANRMLGYDCKIEIIRLEEGVEIDNLAGQQYFSIAFTAPMPTVKIYPSPPAGVRLVMEGRARSVCVNNLGLIELMDECGTNSFPKVTSCAVTDQPDGDGRVTVDENTEFTINATANDYDGNDTISNWYVDWGDLTEEPIVACSGASCNANKTHTYNSAGTKTIKVRVEDDQGASSAKFACNPSITAVENSLIGWAWSENLGWIDFCPGGTPPSGPDSACSRLESNKLRGWAKVVDTGEWISLHCESEGNCTSSYGVTFDSVTNKFGGKAKMMSNGDLICFDSTDC